MSELLPIVQGGLSTMNERVADTFGGVGAFADLSEGQQDEIITAVEQEDPNFFFFARVVVLMSLMAEPEYAGNVDRVGWQLIGRGGEAVFHPPFGFYDRDEHRAPTTGADQ